MKKKLWISCIKDYSKVNGSGNRCVIWTQGCSLRCPGCFNTGLQPFQKGKSFDPVALGIHLAQLNCDGLTISGGEPLDQNHALYKLMCTYKQHCEKIILLFTGYSLQEIKKSPKKLRTILVADAALCGRYLPGLQWNNKRLLLISGRLTEQEILPNQDIEMSIQDGMAYMTGYPNL